MRPGRPRLICHLMGDRLRFLAVKGGMFGSGISHVRDVPLGQRRHEDPRAHADAIFKELEAFLQSTDFPNSPAVVALSRELYVWRSFRVPPVTSGSLDSLIAYEVERHLPVGADSLYVRTLAGQGEGPGWHVQLLAARRDVVRPLLEALDLMGCRLAAIVPDSLGALAEVRFVGGKQPAPGDVIAVHDRESVEVYLFRDDAPAGGAVSVIGSDRPSGEDASGAGQLAARAQRIASGIESALSEARQAVGDSPAARRDERRWLLPSSGGSDLVMEYLRRDTAAEWSLVTPTPAPAAMRDAPRYSVSLGLSREPDRLVASPLNFLSAAATAGKSLPAMVTAACAAILLIALVLLGAGVEYQTRRESRLLDGRIDALRAQAEGVTRLGDTLRSKEGELRHLAWTVTEAPTMIDLLAELSQVLPPNAHLTQFVLKGDSVELSGFADAASGLIQTLEESKSFRNVAFDAPITTQAAQKERFKIRMALER